MTEKNNLISQLLSTNSTSFNIKNNRTIEHIEVFWKSIIQLREDNHLTEFLYSLLDEAEIRKLYSDNSIGSQNVREQYLSKLAHNHNDISTKANKIKSEVERQRPFIGEKLFFLFINYLTFSMRTTYLLIKDSNKNKCQVWKDEASLVNILKEDLNTEEMKFLMSRDFGSYNNAIGILESKMINQISYSLNGEEAVDNSIKQAERLERLLKVKSE